ETRVIYHLEDQDTPYLVRINVPAQRVTLADFKRVLNKPNLKFFFKSVDDDFGVVKEEISDDDARLPFVNGRVVCWLVSDDTCQSDFRGSDLVSIATPTDVAPPPTERMGGIGDSRPPSFHSRVTYEYKRAANPSVRPSVSAADMQRSEVRPVSPPPGGEGETGGEQGGLNGHTHRQTGGGEAPSPQESSCLETTSFCSSEEDSGGRFSQSAEQSSSSPRLVRRQRRRRRPETSRMERSASFSSITDSTMSVGVVTVTLNTERFHFLGISIVGQSSDRGDGGIYIGSIMKGGAVAADGRIEPGDMLLQGLTEAVCPQVNDVNFENMSNDDAVGVLRDVVHKPGPITLTVAKCWDPTPRGCFTLPRGESAVCFLGNHELPGNGAWLQVSEVVVNLRPAGEPVRPIDPAAWVSHTAAYDGQAPPTLQRPSGLRCFPGVGEEHHLSIHSDTPAVVRAMADPESGLEVRDRMWLKITIPKAFIGSEVVDWLHRNVEGFLDRREARKYAGNLLKAGYIRHTVNKVTFSEQCYYVFGDVCGGSGSGASTSDDQGCGLTEPELTQQDDEQRLGGPARGLKRFRSSLQFKPRWSPFSVWTWLVSDDTCQSDFRGSDLVSIATPTDVAPPPTERMGGIGDSRPPSFQ
ncbi:unnamed protein product, partial [Tetraodon nigroviridis]